LYSNPKMLARTTSFGEVLMFGKDDEFGEVLMLARTTSFGECSCRQGRRILGRYWRRLLCFMIGGIDVTIQS